MYDVHGTYHFVLCEGYQVPYTTHVCPIDARTYGRYHVWPLSRMAVITYGRYHVDILPLSRMAVSFNYCINVEVALTQASSHHLIRHNDILYYAIPR